MTLDQIWFRLCNKNNLKKGSTMDVAEAMGSLKKGEDGKYQGKDVDGNVIRKKIGGKSYARQLMEEQAAKEEKERRKKNKRRRHGRS